MRPGSTPEPPAERYRRQTYAGLEILSDSIDRENEPDFALGLAPAPTILARLTVRRRVRRALDLGTGTGVQALLAARHADRVVGVDVNRRALEFAACNAARNGIDNVEWRFGSWFEPVGGERFDLILVNPPYVISPDRVLYRDSGEADGLARTLLRGSVEHLEEGGFAQVLCNWVVRGADWRAPIAAAVAGTGADAVILLYGIHNAEKYARVWNHPLQQRDARTFDAAVARWLAFYGDAGIDEIAFGMVTLRRWSADRNWLRAFRVPGSPTDGAGSHLERLFRGWDAVRAGLPDGVELSPGARILRRLDLATGRERFSLEVRPNVGFSAPIDAETASCLERGEPLPDGERRRLLGLGMLVDGRSRDAARSSGGHTS